MAAPRHRAGEAGYRRLAVAMFMAGLGTFAMLYSPQALLPLFTDRFGVSPAIAALVLSLGTAAVGVTLLFAGWLSDAIGRTRVMKWSIALAALLGLLASAAPSFETLLAARVLQGIALAGIPPVALAYLAEEVDATAIGLSVGLFVGGNAIGGMVGRFLAGGLADLGGWRLALLGIGTLGVVCWISFAALLPSSRHFAPAALKPRRVLRGLASAAHDGVLARLDAVGALLAASFVAIFSALTFRLTSEPYGLSQAAVGAVFLLYLLGSASSTAAGRLADRIGRAAILPLGIATALAGVALTSAEALWLVLVGVAVFTVGFFAAHAAASSWVGQHGVRVTGSASQASSLYLLSYYTGTSLGGIAAGAAWSAAGWTGVAALVGALLLAGLLLAFAPGVRAAGRIR